MNKYKKITPIEEFYFATFTSVEKIILRNKNFR